MSATESLRRYNPVEWHKLHFGAVAEVLAILEYTYSENLLRASAHLLRTSTNDHKLEALLPGQRGRLLELLGEMGGFDGCSLPQGVTADHTIVIGGNFPEMVEQFASVTSREITCLPSYRERNDTLDGTRQNINQLMAKFASPSWYAWAYHPFSAYRREVNGTPVHYRPHDTEYGLAVLAAMVASNRGYDQTDPFPANENDWERGLPRYYTLRGSAGCLKVFPQITTERSTEVRLKFWLSLVQEGLIDLAPNSHIQVVANALGVMRVGCCAEEVVLKAHPRCNIYVSAATIPAEKRPELVATALQELACLLTLAAMS